NFGQRTYLTGNLLFLVACAASAFYNTYCKFLVERKYTELEILVYTSVVGCLASIPLFIWLEPLHLSTLRGLDRTAILGGLGGDFHASARVVSLAGGAGAFFPGILGCLLFPIIAKRLPLLFLYLADGILGSLFTLSLILLPHTPVTFALAIAGEYLFQAFAFSIQVGIMFETIGPNN